MDPPPPTLNSLLNVGGLLLYVVFYIIKLLLMMLSHIQPRFQAVVRQYCGSDYTSTAAILPL